MIKYVTIVKLTNGNSYMEKIMDRTEEGAKQKILHTDGFKEWFRLNGGEIEEITAKNINQRFAYYPGKEKNIYIVRDNKNGIKVRFVWGKFNETQQVFKMDDFDTSLSADELATAMREIGDYMSTYHRDDIFGTHTYLLPPKMLSDLMNQTNMTLGELSRKSGVEHGRIIEFLNGERGIDVNIYFRLVRACGAEVLLSVAEDK